MSKIYFSKPLRKEAFIQSRRYLYLLACCVALFGVGGLKAQSWSRESIKAPTQVAGVDGTTSSGNIDGSKFKGTLSLKGGLEYSDNVRLERDAKSGLALVLGGNVGFSMPLTVNNELYLQVSVLRYIYISGEKGTADFQSITPGSSLGFDVFVGRAKVRSFVNFSLQEDPVASVVVNETDRFGRLNVDGGVQLDWDMNKVVIQSLAMIGRQWHTAGDGSLDARRHALNLRSYFPNSSAGGWGLSAGLSGVDYDLRIQNDVETTTFGVFSNYVLSKNMQIAAEIGLQSSEFDNAGSIVDAEDYDGLYGSLVFDHQVKRSMRYTLALVHSANEGIGTNFYEVTSLSFTPQVSLWRNMYMDLSVGYDWIDESGLTGEEATRIRAGAKIQKPLSSSLTGSLAWRYTEKTSDFFARNYQQNRLTLLLEYSPL